MCICVSEGERLQLCLLFIVAWGGRSELHRQRIIFVPRRTVLEALFAAPLAQNATLTLPHRPILPLRRLRVHLDI